MDSPRNVPVRSARDRLIDLLNLGDTYPLSDLDVVADQLKVAFGGTAKIPIENAQAGVTYQLCDPKGVPLGDAYRLDGNDGRIEIESPPVQENVTYRILATKKPAAGQTPQQPRFLDERAPVTVGIDTRLPIAILDAPLLDLSIAKPQPADPRIVPYGASVDIRVDKSQEGVEYSLVVGGKDLPKPVVTGNLKAIVLPTGPIYEDTDIQVRATKNFLADGTARRPETDLLDGRLYLKAMADRSLAVTVDPAPVIDYGADTAIRIAGTQTSTAYQLYMCKIADRDFVHDAADAPVDRTESRQPIVVVPVVGKPDVRIRRIEPSAESVPPGYAPVGAAVGGNAGDLVLPVNALMEDAVFFVQAVKQHRVDADDAHSPLIASTVALNRAVGTLVRPDRSRKMTLRVLIDGRNTGDTIAVSGGQPGVFYWFRVEPGGPELPLPVYFHKRDDADPARNKGIGQLGVKIDLVVAKLPESRPGNRPDRATLAPLDPVLSIAPLAADTRLSVRAVKAQTGVEAPMTQNADIEPVAEVSALPAEAGNRPAFTVTSSSAFDTYRAIGNDSPLGTRAGTGADLMMFGQTITADGFIELDVWRTEDRTMRVVRTLRVPVMVRPDARLALVAADPEIDYGAGTTVVVQSSQRGVDYQLMSGKAVVGTKLPGNGGDLSLPTGPLGGDQTFTMIASRSDDASIATILAASVAVKVGPAPPASSTDAPPPISISMSAVAPAPVLTMEAVPLPSPAPVSEAAPNLAVEAVPSPAPAPVAEASTVLTMEADPLPASAPAPAPVPDAHPAGVPDATATPPLVSKPKKPKPGGTS